jgi:hypothetical protein
MHLTTKPQVLNCLLPLENYSGFARIDGEDFLRLSRYEWFFHKPSSRYGGSGTVYSTRRYPGDRIKLANAVMGTPPSGLMWDHKNRNGLDNRRSNLRIATKSQNNANRRCVSKSGYHGVFYWKSRNKWRAWSRSKGFLTSVYFDDPVAAAKFADRVAFLRFGEFAVLNFPIQRFPRL